MFGAPVSSVALFLLASFLGALGQYLYKAAADHSSSIPAALLSWNGLAGVACYIAVMILFLVAFKLGGSVAVLYPIYATTFLWALLIAHFRLGDAIRWPNVAGMALLIIGIFLMGLRPAAASGS
jgi:drug/metabolite transporter (DMT)-like permease